MRERPGTVSPAHSLQTENVRHVPYDERTFFESLYRATAREGPLNDRHTIGHISEPEARFHYNAVENSIIRAVLRREPAPAGALLHAWRLTQQRRRLRLLDVGAGTGHWVDFFRETFFVSDVVAVEIVGELATWLREKYAGQPVQEQACAIPGDVGRRGTGRRSADCRSRTHRQRSRHHDAGERPAAARSRGGLTGAASMAPRPALVFRRARCGADDDEDRSPIRYRAGSTTRVRERQQGRTRRCSHRAGRYCRQCRRCCRHRPIVRPGRGR